MNIEDLPEKHTFLGQLRRQIKALENKVINNSSLMVLLLQVQGTRHSWRSIESRVQPSGPFGESQGLPNSKVTFISEDLCMYTHFEFILKAES